MTQFDLYKAEYQQLVKQGEMTAEEAAPKIRVLDFLASCSKDDFYQIADTAALNNVIEGYTNKACKSAGLTDEQTERVMKALDAVLESMTAEEAAE